MDWSLIRQSARLNNWRCYQGRLQGEYKRAFRGNTVVKLENRRTTAGFGLWPWFQWQRTRMDCCRQFFSSGAVSWPCLYSGFFGRTRYVFVMPEKNLNEIPRDVRELFQKG